MHGIPKFSPAYREQAARIPELNGELVITRYTLRELLDKLDELTTGHDGRPGSAPD
jgi:hypothetical protein